MKSAFIYLILAALCIGCKNHVEPTENPRIKRLAGEWKLAEIRVTDDGTRVWQAVPFDESNNIEVLPNGVILDYKKQSVCCHPKELVVNGSIELVNAYIRYPNNASCSISCVQCQVWTITYIDGEMVITGCLEGDMKKYRR